LNGDTPALSESVKMRFSNSLNGTPNIEPYVISVEKIFNRTQDEKKDQFNYLNPW